MYLYSTIIIDHCKYNLEKKFSRVFCIRLVRYLLSGLKGPLRRGFDIDRRARHQGRREPDTSPISSRAYDKMQSVILSQRKVRYWPLVECTKAYLPCGPSPTFSISPSWNFNTFSLPCFGYLHRICFPTATWAAGETKTLLLIIKPFQTFKHCGEENVSSHP